MDNTTNYNVSGITYDQNGNITKLLRKGHTNESATTFGNMDNLTYGYDSGNKLLSVTDAVATPTLMKGEFKDGNKTGNDYNYDDNGNLIQDLNKGIAASGITYNHLNLPSSITTTSGNISYIYDASGTKLQKRVTEGSSVTSITDYAGNYIYENGDLQFFTHPEGYVNAEGEGYEYVYQYKDHLGNIRLSYTDDQSNLGTPTIIEENNYYPFGLEHKGYNNVVSANSNRIAKKFKYQNQELNNGLGYDMFEFELRHYDPAIGRFVTTDPYEQFNSQYLAMGNNPVVSIDPNGGLCYDANGNAVACPDGENYDQYRDNENNHINLLDEVVLTPEDSNDNSTTIVSLGPAKGTKVLDAKASNLGRFWATIEPRKVEVNGISYNVDAKGEITMVTPLGSAGALGMVGPGGFKITNIAGFYVRAKTLFQGGVYTKTIQSLASLSEGTSLIKLVKTIETEAKAAGATKIVIEGVEIVNKKILSVNPNAAAKLGYTLEKTSETSIKLVKQL